MSELDEGHSSAGAGPDHMTAREIEVRRHQELAEENAALIERVNFLTAQVRRQAQQIADLKAKGATA